MSQYVAAYDISDDQARGRVARVLERFGLRLQRSVFLLDITPADLRDLTAAVGPHLARADDFELIPIDAARDRPHFRWQADPSELESVIFVD